ncbi:unnamed protein product, partial [Didymodactylos carnosus]
MDYDFHFADFRLKYHSEDAINWYVRDTFVFRSLNKILRTDNIDDILIASFFVVDLYNQIDKLHDDFTASLPVTKTTLTVYRGQIMSCEEVNVLRSQIGGCIFAKTYLSTTTDPSVAYKFCGIDIDLPEDMSIEEHGSLAEFNAYVNLTKENVKESDDNSPKKIKINDYSNNIVNDNTTIINAASNTEPSSGIQSNINENCSLSTTRITTTNDDKKRTYQKWYSKDYKWLVYEPNNDGFCCICRDYWKPTIPSYSEMNTRTRGVFTIQPFVNWKCAPGRRSVAQQLFNVNELERQENRHRFGDLLDGAYFLFKHELPHTTLYAPLLELLSKIDHTKKLSTVFDKCQKNATYDSTTTVTELLQSTSEVIDKQVLTKIRESRIISIMADEGTDINHYQNLSICIRYCNQDTDAQTIFDTIVKELKSKNIDMTKIRFTGFDGASVFSEECNGVSAKFRQIYSNSILFIHCRAHILQLCLLSACEDIPEVQESLLALKSLFNFINRSSTRLARFNDIQTLLKHPQLKLIQPGDTRWLSYSRSINAVIRCYEPLMITLEHIANERG